MAPHGRTIIVIGSGPKIGSHVAALFATRGFTQVALLSRNEARLKEDQAFVLQRVVEAGIKSITIKTYPVDLQAEPERLQEALQKVGKDLGVPEVVVFNASKLEASAMFEYEERSMEQSFRVGNSISISVRVLKNHASCNTAGIPS